MKVIICGGGTVGHITPGISIAQIIKRYEPNAEIIFVGREGGNENKLILNRGFKLKTIKVNGLKRALSLSNIKALFLLKRGLTKAKDILLNEKPDVVIGTGGYVCWPIVKKAQELRIRTILHESNFTPGLALKSLAPSADAVLLNFKETVNELKRKDNVFTVGNPIPEEFFNTTREAARKTLGIKPNEIYIVSYGGSGGADLINQSILSLMRNYSKKNKAVKHLHATGKKYFDSISEYNSDLTKEADGCKIIPFIEKMHLHLKAADMVICRSGAMTLSEVAASGAVPILIPSPNVTGNHQYKNAKQLTDKGAAIMIEESELNDRVLRDAVDYLIKNKYKREEMKKRLVEYGKSYSPQKIFKIIINKN